MRCDEGKRKFSTDLEAREGIEILRASALRKGKSIPELRTYLCPFCDSFHITKQPKITPYAQWKSGGNRDLALKLTKRAAETPLFDALVRAYNLKGKAYR